MIKERTLNMQKGGGAGGGERFTVFSEKIS